MTDAVPPDRALLELERELLAELAGGAALREVLERFVLAVEARSPPMLTSILLTDARRRHLVHGAAPSLPAAYNAAIDGLATGPNQGSCGTAVHCGHPIYVFDIATDPLWRDFKHLALPHGLRACWSVPIQSSDGAILGTFAMYHREPKGPTWDQRALILNAGLSAARLIERGRSVPVWSGPLDSG